MRLAPAPVPRDCADGFYGAFWRRPTAYLDPRVRAGISVFAALSAGDVDRAVETLDADLRSGAWQKRHRPFRPRGAGPRLLRGHRRNELMTGPTAVRRPRSTATGVVGIKNLPGVGQVAGALTRVATIARVVGLIGEARQRYREDPAERRDTPARTFPSGIITCPLGVWKGR